MQMHERRRLQPQPNPGPGRSKHPKPATLHLPVDLVCLQIVRFVFRVQWSVVHVFCSHPVHTYVVRAAQCRLLEERRAGGVKNYSIYGSLRFS